MNSACDFAFEENDDGLYAFGVGGRPQCLKRPRRIRRVRVHISGWCSRHLEHGIVWSHPQRDRAVHLEKYDDADRRDEAFDRAVLELSSRYQFAVAQPFGASTGGAATHDECIICSP